MLLASHLPKRQWEEGKERWRINNDNLTVTFASLSEKKKMVYLSWTCSYFTGVGDLKCGGQPRKIMWATYIIIRMYLPGSLHIYECTNTIQRNKHIACIVVVFFSNLSLFYIIQK